MRQEPFCEIAYSVLRHRCYQGAPFFLACLKSVVKYTHHASRSVGWLYIVQFFIISHCFLFYVFMFVVPSYFLDLVPNRVQSAFALFITYHSPSIVCFVFSFASHHLNDHFHCICFICLLRHSTLVCESFKHKKMKNAKQMQACFHLHALL